MHFEPLKEKVEYCSRTIPFVSNKDRSKVIYINNVAIKKVTQTKFLGVIIDDGMHIYSIWPKNSGLLRQFYVEYDIAYLRKITRTFIMHFLSLIFRMV